MGKSVVHSSTKSINVEVENSASDKTVYM